VELHPVDDHGMPHQVVVVVIEVGEDGVADEATAVVHGDELLRPVHGELGEGVHGEAAQQALRIGAAQEEVGHVVRLVEQGATRAP
jgi:predicted N-formylglutamate amidohydrolase